MNTVYPKPNDPFNLNGGSKLQVKAFEKGDPSPFNKLDFNNSNVYELIDYTLRTPLEKMDVFNELLQVPYDCELWVLPVTEEATSILREIPKGDTYEKTASLFAMLSAVKDTVERDRTFLVADGKVCEALAEKIQELGFTLKKMDQMELQTIELK